MLVDKPLSINDVLNEENERERIKLLVNTTNDLLSNNDKGSVSIAISGDWGSGKTTYLKALESFYRDYMECPVLFFEAWKHHDEDNPLVSLILSLRELPGIKTPLKTKLSKALKPFLASAITVSDIMLGFLTKKGIKSIEEAFELIEKEQLTLVSKYRDNLNLFEKTLAEIKDNYTPEKNSLKKVWKDAFKDNKTITQKKRIVIIIDDLDRLVAEKAFKIIETLRFYFDIDDALIIMGTNDEILNAYVREQFDIKNDSNGNRRGERFLEKIFHWNYEIACSNLNSIHLRSIKKVIDEKDVEKIIDVLSNIDLLTHRKWIKLINRIEKESAQNKAEIERIIFFAVLKELYPRFELFSRKFPEILNALYDKEGTDNEIMAEAIKIIGEDNDYLAFPKKNYDTLKEVIKSISKKEKDF